MENPHKDKKIKIDNELHEISESKQDNISTIQEDQRCNLNKHFKFLQEKQNRLKKYYGLDQKNLSDYKNLLENMLKMGHPDLKSILSIADIYFKLTFSFDPDGESNDYGASLLTKEFLPLLIRLYDNPVENAYYNIASERERAVICFMIHEIDDGYAYFDFNAEKTDFINNLLKILVRNNLLPTLNDSFIDKRSDAVIDGRTFLMELAYKPLECELFRCILNKADGNEDWDHILKMKDLNNETVLHYAVRGLFKDNIKVILELMNKHGLSLDNFILMKNNKGETPLDLAENVAYDDWAYMPIRLFLNKGLDNQELPSLLFLTALKANSNSSIDQDLLSSQLPESVLEYCKTLAKINQHCSNLEQHKHKFAPRSIYAIDIGVHKKLLYELFCIESNRNLNLIIDIFRRDLETSDYEVQHFVTQNIVLMLLINRKMAQIDKVSSELEKKTILHIKHPGLCLFLILNNLFSLEHFNIDKLFTMREDRTNWTILHFLGANLLHASNDELVRLLALVKDKSLISRCINCQDENGRTPLMIAADCRNSKVIELLKNYDAKLPNINSHS